MECICNEGERMGLEPNGQLCDEETGRYCGYQQQSDLDRDRGHAASESHLTGQDSYSRMENNNNVSISSRSANSS